jgi:hypothetical protein
VKCHIFISHFKKLGNTSQEFPNIPRICCWVQNDNFLRNNTENQMMYTYKLKCIKCVLVMYNVDNICHTVTKIMKYYKLHVIFYSHSRRTLYSMLHPIMYNSLFPLPDLTFSFRIHCGIVGTIECLRKVFWVWYCACWPAE